MVIIINSPISWIGGKKALREIIVDRFPLNYEQYTYVELFAGGAWVFFYKYRSQAEILNDFNSNLYNLYCCIREQPDALIESLTPALNSREEFERIRQLLKNPFGLTEVERAAYFYEQIKFSYASKTTTFGGRPCNLWARFPSMLLASERLNGVVVENQDFEDIIRRYDSPTTFFYADPPYVDTEDYYNDVNFGKDDHLRLAIAAHKIIGKILISYNACRDVYELYADDEFRIEEVKRLNNMAQRTAPGAMYAEYLISNYDTMEQALSNAQLTLWARESVSELNCDLMKERKWIWIPKKRTTPPLWM